MFFFFGNYNIKSTAKTTFTLLFVSYTYSKCIIIIIIITLVRRKEFYYLFRNTNFQNVLLLYRNLLLCHLIAYLETFFFFYFYLVSFTNFISYDMHHLYFDTKFKKYNITFLHACIFRFRNILLYHYLINYLNISHIISFTNIRDLKNVLLVLNHFDCAYTHVYYYRHDFYALEFITLEKNIRASNPELL